MPLSTSCAKVTFVGRFGTSEEWNTGFWVESPAWGSTTPDPATLNGFALQMLNDFTTAWSTLRANASPSVVPEACRVHFYPVNSATVTGTGEAVGEIAPGSAASNIHPNQIGIVCSLRTVVPTRRGRGRMYLPLNAIAVTGAGFYTASVAATIASNMQSFLNTVNTRTLGGQPLNVVVASQAAGSAGNVTAIRVNDIPDVQRRRANQLVPTTENLLPITS